MPEEIKENKGQLFIKEEKGNIIDILSNAIRAVKFKDTFKLKELSNRTIHSASVYQDADSIALAVLIYSLGKIIERTDYLSYGNWKIFIKSCIKNLKSARDSIRKDDITAFQEVLAKLRRDIIMLSGPMSKQIEEVFRKAMINKASRIYEHGISEAKTAELLGVSLWELAEYAGQTGIHDINLSITQDIKTRLAKTLKLFG